MPALAQPVHATTLRIGDGEMGAREAMRLMRQLIRQYKNHPTVIVNARNIITEAGVGSHQYRAQVNAIYCWIKNNIVFVRDPTGDDLFQSPDMTLTVGTGDCDDMVILQNSLLESIGHPTAIVAIQEPGSPTFNHVLGATLIGQRWVILDPSDETAVMGYVPPSLRQMTVYV